MPHIYNHDRTYYNLFFAHPLKFPFISNIRSFQTTNRGQVYKVDFTTELGAGQSLTFEVEITMFDELKPLPAEISQAERQLVLYSGNQYFYSLYATKRQSTVFNLASDKTESYSQLKPVSKSDTTITYGPYENVKPFEQVIFWLLAVLVRLPGPIFLV